VGRYSRPHGLWHLPSCGQLFICSCYHARTLPIPCFLNASPRLYESPTNYLLCLNLAASGHNWHQLSASEGMVPIEKLVVPCQLLPAALLKNVPQKYSSGALSWPVLAAERCCIVISRPLFVVVCHRSKSSERCRWGRGHGKVGKGNGVGNTRHAGRTPSSATHGRPSGRREAGWARNLRWK
jgi:hypothetical protein